MTASTRGPGRSQPLTALIVGGVIALVGLVGFALVPVEGLLFGVFGVNALHNAFHLLTGLVGVVAGYFAAGAYSDEYNKYGGLLYLLLAGLWLVVPAALAGPLNVNFADTVLHLVLGVVLAGVGFGLADRLG